VVVSIQAAKVFIERSEVCISFLHKENVLARNIHWLCLTERDHWKIMQSQAKRLLMEAIMWAPDLKSWLNGIP
jgi:hypothetical protein